MLSSQLFASLLAIGMLHLGAMTPLANDASDSDTPAIAPRPLVTQRHSIAAFTASMRSWPSRLRLLPLRDRLSPELESSSEQILAYDTDAMIDLVRLVVQPRDWEGDEGWRVEPIHSRHLLITAPAEVHAKVGELLATLERDLLPSERLEIRLLDGGVAASGRSIWVDRATADRRLAASPPRHVARIGLRDLVATGGEFGKAHDYTEGWDSKLAQGTFAADPIRGSWLDGLRVTACGTRVDGGALVSLIVTAAEPLAPTESIELDTNGLLNLKPALIERATAGRVDLPRAGFVSFAGTLLLTEGNVLWLPVTQQTSIGPVDRTLEIRCELGSSKVAATIDPVIVNEGDGEGQGGSMRFCVRRPPGLIVPSIDAISPFEYESNSTVGWFNQQFSGDLNLASFDDHPDADLIVEVARSAAIPEVEEMSGCQLCPMGGHYLLTLLPVAANDRVTRALATISPPESGATIRGRVRVGGAVRGEFALPIMIDRTAVLWTGLQTPAIRGWKQEVTNEVACASPVIDTVIDGIALRFELLRSVRGELVLDVRGTLQLLDELPKLIDLGDAAHQVVHGLRASIGTLNDRVTVPAKGGSVTLGGDVQLELEVTPN